MVKVVNHSIWFVAAALVLFWVFIPQLTKAHPVLLPKPPHVDTVVLPPVMRLDAGVRWSPDDA